MIKSTKKLNLTAIMTIAVVGVFLWYFYANKESFEPLLRVSILFLITIFLTKVARIYVNGLFIKYTLSAYQKNIPSKESFYIALLSSMGNFFGPYLGGASIRAVYLKKKYQFSYTNFMSTLSGYYFISFLVSSALGLLALVAIHVQTGTYSWLAYLIFAGWFITTLVFAEVRSINGVIAWLKNVFKPLRKFLNKINDVIRGWRVVKDNKQLFWRLNRLTVYGFVISIIVAYLEFSAIGVSIALAPLGLYTALSALSMLISVTPASIGIREGLFIFSSDLLGVSTEQILQVAVIDRSLTFLVMIAAYLFSKLSKSHKATLNSGELK